ncbi:MAG: hypothetical protein ABH836_00445 [Candidatus Omnitrophota bacterium]
MGSEKAEIVAGKLKIKVFAVICAKFRFAQNCAYQKSPKRSLGE